MAAIYKALFVLSTFLTVSSAQNVLTRTVKAQCYKNSRENTLTANFRTKLNTDPINYLFGLDLMPGSNPEMYSKSTACVYTNVNGVMSVETTVDLADFAQTNNPCGVREVYSTTLPTQVIGYKWRIALRYWETDYLRWTDRDYVFDCYIATATDTWLTTQLQVVSPGPVSLQPQTPTISFEVIRNGVDAKIDSCNVGELLQLQLKMTVFGWQEYVSPSGVYSYNTYVNWESNFASSVADQLIGQDGCSISGNVLSLDTTTNGGFKSYSVGRTGTNNANLQFIARTGTFRCRKYPSSSVITRNMLHFMTTVSVCFGGLTSQGQTDLNCQNFCQYGPARRRRETVAMGNFTNIVTSIQVVDEQGSETNDELDRGTTTLMIVAPIVGVLVILISVVGVMLCCWMNRRTAVRKRRLESRTSSASSIPEKF